MSISSRVQCLVCGSVVMHCTCATGPCLHSGAGNLIAALRAERDALKARVGELGDELAVANGGDTTVGILYELCEMRKALGLEIIKTSYSEIVPAIKALKARLRECEHEHVTLRHTLDDLVEVQRSRAERAAARCEALESKRKWHSIETAPRDGTHFLAWDGVVNFDHSPPTIVHWFEDGFYTSVNELAPERPYPAKVWTPGLNEPEALAALAAVEGK